jgi:hypothetical protein
MRTKIVSPAGLLTLNIAFPAFRYSLVMFILNYTLCFDGCQIKMPRPSGANALAEQLFIIILVIIVVIVLTHTTRGLQLAFVVMTPTTLPNPIPHKGEFSENQFQPLPLHIIVAREVFVNFLNSLTGAPIDKSGVNFHPVSDFSLIDTPLIEAYFIGAVPGEGIQIAQLITILAIAVVLPPA